MAIDWAVIKEMGGLGIAVVAFIFVWNVFKVVTSQWKASTEAVNKNTEAFNELSKVFKKSHERELEFQAEILETMKETHLKVAEIHATVVPKKENHYQN